MAADISTSCPDSQGNLKVIQAVTCMNLFSLFSSITLRENARYLRFYQKCNGEIIEEALIKYRSCLPYSDSMYGDGCFMTFFEHRSTSTEGCDRIEGMVPSLFVLDLGITSD